jgi:glucose-1-phosphatase
MISTVLFDMNDVLFRYDLGVRVAHLGRVSGKPTAAEAAIWGSGFEDSGNAGVMDADALPALANVSARPLTQDEWAEALRIAVAPTWPAQRAQGSARIFIGPRLDSRRR